MNEKKPTVYQQSAVEAVINAFESRSRYLVADEAGLGKTIVAKGVIEEWSKKRNKSNPQKPFVVVYFGSNVFLLNDTINKLVDKSKNYNLVEADRLDELIAYKCGIDDKKLDPDKINIIACSANIVNDEKSKNGEPNERLLCRKYIYLMKDDTTLKNKIVDYGWFSENDWTNLCKCEEASFVGTINEKGNGGKFLEKIQKGNYRDSWCATFRTYLNDVIMSSTDDVCPDLVIVDEFHRYDDVLVDNIAKLIKTPEQTKLLMLSATPYNLYRDDWGDAYKEYSDEEGADESKRFTDFWKLLSFVVNDDSKYKEIKELYKKYLENKIETSEISSSLMEYIFRNERPLFGETKYKNIPTICEIKGGEYDNQITYLADIVKSKNESHVAKFRKIVPGVYSFPVKTYTNEHDDFYQGFPKVGENIDLSNEDFIFTEDGFCSDKIKSCLHTKLIQEYVAEMGRKLLWVPATKPLYQVSNDSVFSKTEDFSKLLVFSNYKMIPRAVSAIFSAYADEVENVPSDTCDLQCMNQWINELNDTQLQELMGAYIPEAGDFLDSVIKRVNTKIKNIKNINIEDDRKELITLYIIASPFASAWRLLGDDSKKRNIAMEIANAFDSYFKKRHIVLHRNNICNEKGLLWYCANGNLQAVLAEYAFCNSKWAETLIYVLTSKMKGNNKDKAVYQYTPIIHVYRQNNYSDPNSEVKTVTCHFALRYDGDYGDNGGSDTSDIGKTYKQWVKMSFNSPFWPFVLCTTSAAQEGIDLDTYSYRIMHYSLPNSTMAFEQRDGRIDRRRSLLARKKMVKECNSSAHIDYQHYWENLFGQNKGCSGMMPDWVQKSSDPDSVLERIIPFFPGSPEYIYFMKLVAEKDKYRGRFGMPNENVDTKTSPLKLNKIEDCE